MFPHDRLLATSAQTENPDVVHAPITLECVDALQRQMREQGATITETVTGQIIVSKPEPPSEKHLRQKKSNRKYTKLSMAIDKENAAAFAAACRQLGVTQAAVLMPVIKATIVSGIELIRRKHPCQGKDVVIQKNKHPVFAS
jgi:hypothetical protein